MTELYDQDAWYEHIVEESITTPTPGGMRLTIRDEATRNVMAEIRQLDVDKAIKIVSAWIRAGDLTGIAVELTHELSA